MMIFIDCNLHRFIVMPPLKKIFWALFLNWIKYIDFLSKLNMGLVLKVWLKSRLEKNLFNYITAVDSATDRISTNHLHRRALLTQTYQKVMRQVSPPLSLTCQIHSVPFMDIFIKIWIKTSLNFILKEKCEKMKRQN